MLEDWNANHLLADGIAHAYEDLDDPWHDAARAGVRAAEEAAREGRGPRETPFLQIVVEFLLARHRPAMRSATSR